MLMRIAHVISARNLDIIIFDLVFGLMRRRRIVPLEYSPAISVTVMMIITITVIAAAVPRLPYTVDFVEF